MDGDAESGFHFTESSFATINSLMQNTTELKTASATIPVGEPLPPIATDDGDDAFGGFGDGGSGVGLDL